MVKRWMKNRGESRASDKTWKRARARAQRRQGSARRGERGNQRTSRILGTDWGPSGDDF